MLRCFNFYYVELEISADREVRYIRGSKLNELAAYVVVTRIENRMAAKQFVSVSSDRPHSFLASWYG